jgi:hypothetical protein
VFLHDLCYVVLANLGVPNPVRIHHHCCSNRTEANRAAFCNHDAALRILAFFFFAEEELPGEKFTLKRELYRRTVNRRTRFAGTNKNMMLDRRTQNWGKPFEPFTVFDEIVVRHRFKPLVNVRMLPR